MTSDESPVQKIEIIARGVLTWGAFTLVCRNLKHDYFYLPGGHVEPGECASDACTREFLEETGLVIRTLGCVLVCEARFTQHGKRRHEITTVFHVEHAGESHEEWGVDREKKGGPPPAVASMEDKIAFEWIDREQLESCDLRPECMRKWLFGRQFKGSMGDTGGPDWISVTE